MKKLLPLIFILIAPYAQAQNPKPITTTTRTTSAQFSPGEFNLCNYITLTVERKEGTGMQPITVLNYQIRNCDDTIYAYTPSTIIPNESFITDTRLSTYTLNVFSPIDAHITWRYPTNYKNSLNQTVRTELNGNVEVTLTNTEEIGATVEGVIGNRTIALTSLASVKTDSKSITKGTIAK